MIHLVTAMFDIGWRGRPGTMLRDVDWYLAHFHKLASLANPMTVFTERKLVAPVVEICQDLRPDGQTEVVESAGVTALETVLSALSFPSDFPRSYIAMMWSKVDFVRRAVARGDFREDDLIAWVDFAGLRWYGIQPVTPCVPAAWVYGFARDRVTWFESGGRISGSMWVCPAGMVAQLQEAFQQAAVMSAARSQRLLDDEAVFRFMIDHGSIAHVVKSLGDENWFGAMAVCNALMGKSLPPATCRGAAVAG